MKIGTHPVHDSAGLRKITVAASSVDIQKFRTLQSTSLPPGWGNVPSCAAFQVLCALEVTITGNNRETNIGVSRHSPLHIALEAIIFPNMEFAIPFFNLL